MEKTQDLGYILIVSPKPTKPVSIAFFTARCQFGMEAQPASHNYLLFFAFADIAEATSKWRTAMQWIAATKPAPKRLSSHRCTAKTQVLCWLDNRWFHVCWGNLFLWWLIPLMLPEPCRMPILLMGDDDPKNYLSLRTWVPCCIEKKQAILIFGARERSCHGT